LGVNNDRRIEGGYCIIEWMTWVFVRGIC